MPLGYPKDQNTINNLVGNLGVTINQSFRRAVELKTELDAYTDLQLEGLGYTTAEVVKLRAFAADMVQLNGIYAGTGTLGTVKDFRASVRPVFGVLGDN